MDQRILSIVLGVLLALSMLFGGYVYYDRSQVQKALDREERRVSELTLNNTVLKANQVTLESALLTANNSVDAFLRRELELSEKVQQAQEEAKKKALENANLKKQIGSLERRGNTACERASNLAEDLVRIRSGK